MRQARLEVAVVVTLLALAYLSVSQAFPFYFSWDMDWVTTLDALVIQSGGLPDHVNHTGFGMYFVLAWSQRLASALGWVSFLTLEDVAGAGNPLLGIAELSDYFRRHSPVVLVGLVLAQVVGLVGIARLSRAEPTALARSFPVLVLLLVGVQEGAFYHAAFIRSELYSLLFWCLAFMTGVAALRARSRRTSALRFGLCGLFLALSWTTKLQALLLVGWLVLLLVLLRELGWSRSPLVGLEPARPRGRFAPGLCLFAPAAVVVHGAFTVHVPWGNGAHVATYEANSAAFLVLAIFVAPLLLAMLGRRSPALEALLAGALAAALLHLLVFADPRKGWEYLLVDAKMLLFRTNYQSMSALDPLRLLQRLVDEVTSAPGVYAVHVGLLALALRGRSWRQRALLLAVEGALLLHVGVATRDYLRDLLWVRLPLVLWTVVLATSLLARTRVERGERSRAAGVLLLLVLLVVAQARQVLRLPSRLDAHQLEYSWAIGPWFIGGYLLEQQRFNVVMAEKVDMAAPARWGQVASTGARDWARSKQDLGHALFNQRESLIDVTTAEPGFLLPHDAGRIAAVSSDVRGGLIFRPRVWEPTGRLLDGESVRAQRKNPEGHPVVAPAPDTPRLAVLGRADLDVVLFLPAGAPAPPDWTAGPEEIEVATAAGPARFQAFRADLYGEVEVSRLGGGAFVLVKRRF